MHQLEKGIGTRGPQGLDKPEGHTAAAMDRQPSRLVHHQEAIGLEENASLEKVAQAGPRGGQRGTIPLADGRHPDPVAGIQAVLRLDPPLVDPHLSLAQQTVDPRLGHALETRHQKVVDTLPGLVTVDIEKLYPGRCAGHFNH